MSKPWTKEQYLHWLKTRGEAGGWKYSDCRAASDHIKRETLKKFTIYLRQNYKEPVRSYLLLMVRGYFSEVETDRLLTQLGCYPDYMDRSGG